MESIGYNKFTLEFYSEDSLGVCDPGGIAVALGGLLLNVHTHTHTQILLSHKLWCPVIVSCVRLCHGAVGS